MVCENCQKKLATVIVPDVWKSGARNTIESGGRKVNENTIISKKERNRFEPYDKKCRLCKSKLSQPGNYCNDCAYKKGICSMCGRKILDTKYYKQSVV
jgi:hypothetical protein